MIRNRPLSFVEVAKKTNWLSVAHGCNQHKNGWNSVSHFVGLSQLLSRKIMQKEAGILDLIQSKSSSLEVA